MSALPSIAGIATVGSAALFARASYKERLTDGEKGIMRRAGKARCGDGASTALIIVTAALTVIVVAAITANQQVESPSVVGVHITLLGLLAIIAAVSLATLYVTRLVRHGELTVRIYTSGHCFIMPLLDQLVRIHTCHVPLETPVMTVELESGKTLDVQTMMTYNVTNEGVYEALCKGTCSEEGFRDRLLLILKHCTDVVVKSATSDSRESLASALTAMLEPKLDLLGVELVNAMFTQAAPTPAWVLANGPAPSAEETTNVRDIRSAATLVEPGLGHRLDA